LFTSPAIVRTINGFARTWPINNGQNHNKYFIAACNSSHCPRDVFVLQLSANLFGLAFTKSKRFCGPRTEQSQKNFDILCCVIEILVFLKYSIGLGRFGTEYRPGPADRPFGAGQVYRILRNPPSRFHYFRLAFSRQLWT